MMLGLVGLAACTYVYVYVYVYVCRLESRKVGRSLFGTDRQVSQGE